jgi:hypothetical protein
MDLTEQYLDNVYDCFLQEQLKILQGIKSGSTEHKTTKDHRQISLLTSLLSGVLKLKELRRKEI